MKNIVCYHHNDADGKAAGYIVYDKLGGDLSRYYATSYNDAMDHDVTGASVYIVDISFVSNTIHKLYDILDGKYGKPASVVWIDHHKGSIDDIINSPEHDTKLRSYDNLVFIVYDGFCGAMLTHLYLGFLYEEDHMQLLKTKTANIAYDEPTYQHLQPYSRIRVELDDGQDLVFDVPEWLAYIDDHDCWKKKIPDTDAFILGLDTNDTRLWLMMVSHTGDKEPMLNPVWQRIDEHVEEMIESGYIISNYREATNARNLFARFEVLIDNKKCLAMNARGNSFIFCDYIHQYPCCVAYFYDGKTKNWSMTFYSSDKVEDRMDCCELAKRFGGGGHMGAAGCTVDKPAHEIFEVV